MITAFNKNEFVEEVVKAFFDYGIGMDSVAFLTTFENQLNPDTKANIEMTANAMDDKYGILTLQCRLPGEPIPIEFRLKKPSAYGGPKTEHYVDRIRLKKDAFLTLLEQNNPKRYAVYKAKINALFEQYELLLLNRCAINPQEIRDMRQNNSSGAAHFNQQHEKAKTILACFMEDLCIMMKESLGLDADKAKAALYLTEQNQMSCQRPERITVRKLRARTEEEDLIEINFTTPVDKERTVSSAKKDEPGVANWLLAKTRVCALSPEGTLTTAYEHEVYRSASIVPHALLKKDNFSTQLAQETAKRNLLEHIIPHLAEMHADEAEPIQINYEMLTLLSPISKLVDKAFDPDYAQFMAIKAAFNQFQGRKFYVNLPDGRTKLVQFNAIYHNYGVNAARGFRVEEKANIPAFNQIIMRSSAKLKDFEPFNAFFAQIPDYSPKIAREVQRYHHFMDLMYKRIDQNNEKMSREQHARLLELHAKLLNHNLPASEKAEYKSLSKLFKEIQTLNAPYQEQINLLEQDLLEFEKALAQERKNYFMANMPFLEAELQTLEADQHPSEAEQARTQHLRALLEYVKLVVQGYDKHTLIKKYTSHDLEAMNRLNYEIQSYIEMLSRHCDYNLHVTCKSGKDRTNSYMEKQKAKNLITFIDGHVPRHDDRGSRSREQTLFDDGLLQGPGNDICGDNMKPAAQQLEHVALPSRVNVDILREVSILQKGIDTLKTTTKTRKQVHWELEHPDETKQEEKRHTHTSQYDHMRRMQPRRHDDQRMNKTKIPRIQ